MAIQNWDANQYINHASYVPLRGNPVLELLKPCKGEEILDLGCGEGLLTLKIRESGANVHGIDSSENMIEAAREKGLSAEVCNAEDMLFENQFDAVFSNAALHWMTSPQTVINNVHRSLITQGRFVAEFGGQGNIAALVNAISTIFSRHPDFGAFENPWFFPSLEEYQNALKSSGFKVNYIELIPRPTPIESGVRGWLTVFANSITFALDSNQKEIFYQEADQILKPILFSSKDGWFADYVRLRFHAMKL